MDSLSADGSLVGGAIDLALTVVGGASMPLRQVVRRRRSFPATPDDGLPVIDVTDLFDSTPAAWAYVVRQRYLVVNSIAEGGLLQAELAAYTPQGGTHPTRVVVRVNRPSSVWTANTSYAAGILMTPTPAGGYGYQCTTAGTSGAAPASFPTTVGSTVADGTAVWTSLGPTTPQWTFAVADIASVTSVATAGGVTQIFTSASATNPFGTVTVAAGQFTWSVAGAPDIKVGFDIAEVQSTIASVDPTHPNHLVFATSIGVPWQPSTAYAAGALVVPTTAPGQYSYECTTAGTTGTIQPAFPIAPGATVADGTAVWTSVGPATVLRTITFDQSFDPNTGTWTRAFAITDQEADNRSAGQSAAGLTDGTTYYYASFVKALGTWHAATAYQLGALITPVPANGYAYQCTTAGTSGTVAPAFATATGAAVTDGTAVWTCVGPNPITASTSATGAHGYADRMYGLLPEADRYYDEPTPEATGTGQLRRFLQIVGPGLDQARSLGDGLLSLHDVAEVDAAYLPQLARWIGWDPDLTRPQPLQRNDIAFAPDIFASVGTIPTLRALVNRMSGWPCQIKEFVDNVFLTNAVESVDLWQIFESTSTGGGTAFTVPAPQTNIYPLPNEPAVTQQDPQAFDARPAAVVDAGGTVWLIWHSHRLGSEWQPSTAYTASSLLAPASANGNRYQCTTAGTSGTTAPTFPQTPGATIIDGSAAWTCIGAKIVRRRIWLQRLAADPTPVDAVSDLPDDQSFFDEAPCALFDGTRVWIFWSSNRSGTTDIWARAATAGNPPVLGPAMQLTEDGVNDENPCTMRDSTGQIWVFWQSSRRGPTDIWAITSANDGASWGAASRITTSNFADRTPACVLDGANRVRLFFSSDTGDGRVICQGVLSGAAWTISDVTTSVPGFRDESPAAVVWSGAVWLFWHSNRFGSTWQPSTAFAVGADVLPAPHNGLYYQCTSPGTSGATAPAFPATIGATVTDGSVVWRCMGAVTTAGMTNRFRLWSAADGGGTFGTPAAVLPRLSNDAQPAVIVDHSAVLHLYFASQESGARFRSRTVDTSTTPATGRRQIANKLALGSMHASLDRMHYTYDTPHTTNPAYAGAAAVYARSSAGIYLTPGDGTSSTAEQQTTARVRALVAPFQPLPAALIWYVKQPNGTYTPVFADVLRTTASKAAGP